MSKSQSEASRIAILGCGPAALLTAHTLTTMGCEQDNINIYSFQKNKSPIGGAQFLHAPLNDWEPADAMIEFERLGKPQVYAEKVYGRRSMPTSWSDYEMGKVPAWNLERIYSTLWERWEEHIGVLHVTPTTIDAFRNYWRTFSTIPPQEYCSKHHRHTEARIKISFDDDVEGENVVRYSGEPRHAWYRESRIFGHGFREYGADTKLKSNEWHVEGKKPLNNECTCSPWVIRIGRFGLWDRKVLLHHVPDQVVRGVLG
jgi:hypothetical protein